MDKLFIGFFSSLHKNKTSEHDESPTLAAGSCADVGRQFQIIRLERCDIFLISGSAVQDYTLVSVINL